MKERILLQIELFEDGCIYPYELVEKIKEILEEEKFTWTDNSVTEFSNTMFAFGTSDTDRLNIFKKNYNPNLNETIKSN